MKLEEAIKRFESVQLYKNFKEFIEDCGDSRVKDGVKICGNPVNSLLFRGYGICDEDHCPDYKRCVERAEEHRQLAEWLKELKRLKEHTRWIPVSERLPEVKYGFHDAEDDGTGFDYFGSDRVLVSYIPNSFSFEEKETAICVTRLSVWKYDNGKEEVSWDSVDFDYEDTNPSVCDTITDDDDTYGGKVIAWMPLPEPYKAESEG